MAQVDYAGANAEGASQAQGAMDTWRKNQAFNALQKIYGDPAGNPELAHSLQENAQAAAMNPLLQKQQQLSNAGKDTQNQQANYNLSEEQAGNQRMAQYRAIEGLRGDIKPDGSVDPDVYDKHVDPDLLGIAPEHRDQLKALATQPGFGEHLTTIENSLLGATKAQGATTTGVIDGKSVMIGHDQYNRAIITPLGDVTPVAQERADTGQQGADTRADALANTKRHQGITEGQGAQRVVTGQTNAATAARGEDLRANNSAFGQSANAPAPAGAPGAPAPDKAPVDGMTCFNGLPQKGRQQVVSSAQNLASQKVNLDNANAIMGTMEKQVGPYSTGPGSLTAHFPGTVATNLDENAKSIKAQAAQIVLQGMKNSQGQTGIGRILQAEYNNFTNLYGNLDTKQSAGQYAYHLGLVKQSLNRMFDIQQQSFSAANHGLSHDDVLNSGKPAAGPAAGWKVEKVQ